MTRTEAKYTQDEIAIAVDYLIAYGHGLAEGDREFVHHCAATMFGGNTDRGTRIALQTVGAHLEPYVNECLDNIAALIRKARVAARHEAIRAKGMKVCGRCSGTGEFINGGECWGCDGKGGK